MVHGIKFVGRSIEQMERSELIEDEISEILASNYSTPDDVADGMFSCTGCLRRDTTIRVKYRIVEGEKHVFRVTVLERP